jgi:hypothetical protein
MAARTKANLNTRRIANPHRESARPGDPPNLRPSRWQWAGWLVVGGLLAVSAGYGRIRLAEWLVARTEAQKLAIVAELTPREAAKHVLGLSPFDGSTPAILVAALVDQRPEVSRAAEEALARAVDRWSELRPDEAAPRVAALAEGLARIAPELDEDRRYAAHRLAQRLIVWPLASPEESAATIAACESVLRLPAPRVPDEGWRVASLPAAAEPSIADDPPAEILPPVVEPPIVPVEQPRPIPGISPERIPDASSERPVEPRQFLAPRATRIEG